MSIDFTGDPMTWPCPTCARPIAHGTYDCPVCTDPRPRFVMAERVVVWAGQNAFVEGSVCEIIDGQTVAGRSKGSTKLAPPSYALKWHPGVVFPQRAMIKAVDFNAVVHRDGDRAYKLKHLHRDLPYDIVACLGQPSAGLAVEVPEGEAESEE